MTENPNNIVSPEPDVEGHISMPPPVDKLAVIDQSEDVEGHISIPQPTDEVALADPTEDVVGHLAVLDGPGHPNGPGEDPGDHVPRV